MRFTLGIALAVAMLAGAASAQTPIGPPIKSCAGCEDSNNSCRAACDGLNGPCAIACKDARRICVRRHCILAH